MSEKVLVFNENNFEEKVVQEKLPVLVDFWAGWCVPCKMLAPTIEELTNDYEGRVKFGKVNVDENRELSTRYSIRGIPSLLLFKDGKVAGQMVGVHAKQEIVEMIEKVL